MFSEATRDFLDKVSKLNHLFASHATEHGWGDDCPHTICERVGHNLEEVRSEQSLFRLCVLLGMNLRSAGCWGTDSQLLSLLESDYLREILRRIHELSNERIRGGKCELILAFRHIGSRAPQRTGDHILRAIASALEKNRYFIDPADAWDPFWGIRASDGKLGFAVGLVLHEPNPLRWWHLSLEDRHRRRLENRSLRERLEHIIHSEVAALPFIQDVTWVPDHRDLLLGPRSLRDH
ncbi:MAG: hypothetical protein ACLP7Q_01670 [Isosphaeraceae bacterium]